MLTTLSILAILTAVGIAYYKKKHTFTDIHIPPVTTRRTDLLYGYYGCLDNQVSETIDHINLFMDSQFMGPDHMVSNILTAKMATMIDVSPQVFPMIPGSKFRTVSATAELDLRAILAKLKDAEALQYVKFIYMIDEPNGSFKNVEDLYNGAAIIKRVAKEFTELADVKYVVIYSGSQPTICQEIFDIIGIDNYGQKSAIFNNDYANLKKTLLPHQKTIIVPGGAGNWNQNPDPFVNYAQANSEVAIVMPFLWFDHLNDPNDTTMGIRSGGLKDAYIAAGKYIIGK